MTRLVWAVVLAAALVGCNVKPSEEECEKAIDNIRQLTGQNGEVSSRQRAAVRSCQAQSHRETVECYASARTKAELFACGGELAEAVRKAEEKNQGAGSESGTGSGTGAGAGSGAGSGSGTGAGTGTGAGSETGAGSGSGTGAGSETGGGAGSGGGSGSGAGGGAGSGSGSGSGTGSGTGQ